MNGRRSASQARAASDRGAMARTGIFAGRTAPAPAFRHVMENDTRSISALCRLFELAARSLHSAGFSHGLYPAQWTALRYLSTAGPQERTAARLARFQQMAVGPVTRTVRTLIAKGLVSEGPPAGGHHRSKQLNITPEGMRTLTEDPLLALDAELADLPERDARLLGATLGRVISVLHAKDASDDTAGLRLDDEA